MSDSYELGFIVTPLPPLLAEAYLVGDRVTISDRVRGVVGTYEVTRRKPLANGALDLTVRRVADDDGR